MKKVFLCAILASLSYPAIASSLQDQLSAVAEAEQQGKNEEQRQHDEWVAERNREIQQEKQRRANAQAAANKRAATAAANKHISVGVSFRLHHIGLRSFVLQFLIDKFVFSLNAGFFFRQRQFLFLNL